MLRALATSLAALPLLTISLVAAQQIPISVTFSDATGENCTIARTGDGCVQFPCTFTLQKVTTNPPNTAVEYYSDTACSVFDNFDTVGNYNALDEITFVVGSLYFHAPNTTNTTNTTTPTPTSSTIRSTSISVTTSSNTSSVATATPTGTVDPNMISLQVAQLVPQTTTQISPATQNIIVTNRTMSCSSLAQYPLISIVFLSGPANATLQFYSSSDCSWGPLMPYDISFTPKFGWMFNPSIVAGSVQFAGVNQRIINVNLADGSVVQLKPDGSTVQQNMAFLSSKTSVASRAVTMGWWGVALVAIGVCNVLDFAI